MSQTQLAGVDAHPRRHEGSVVIDAESDIQQILTLLDDADCRAILEATGEQSLSATQISETCDVPSSTVYRKLDRLTEAGLLEEGLRVRVDGKHTREYSRRVDDVVVSVGDGGAIELEVNRADVPSSGGVGE